MSGQSRQWSAALAAFILLPLVSCAEREPTAVEDAANISRLNLQSAGTDRLPVKQTSSGVLYPIGLCGQGVPRLYFEGGGTATHVGRFRIELTACLNQATGATTDGVAVIAAANLDEIHMTFSGQAVSPTELVNTFVLDGGTGRFAHATGEMVIHGFLSTDFSTWTSSGEGWMAYAASDGADR